MNKTTSGWVLFIVALGMMSGLLSNDVAKLTTWNNAFQPVFISIVMAHFSTVVVAFVAGKMIPESREDKQTRSSDLKESK